MSLALTAAAPHAGPSRGSLPANGVSTRSKANTTKPATVDLTALSSASRTIQDQLIKDAQIVPDLADMLTLPGGQSSALYTIFPGDYRVPFQKRKHIGIPPALWEHFRSSKSNCHMGILPEIERAWITLDHKLFLWDYVDGQELSSFVEQPDIITHVALCKPKPAVFIDDIHSLLVICTPVSVILLGLSFANVTGADNRPRKEIKLYATDIVVQTDGIEMTSVVGTNDGRIFMCGGGDGNLYELHYQEKEVWFGKRFHLINHSSGGMPSFLPVFRTLQNEERIAFVTADNERGCFYTLTDHNWISVWKPEVNKGTRKIHTLSNLQKQAQDKAPGSPLLAQGFKLISLHVISQRESRAGVQLMALSSNGVRLYFSAATLSYAYSYGSSHSSSDPRPLQLVHVRLPPPNLLHPDEQFNPNMRLSQANVYGQAAGQQRSAASWSISGLSTSAYIDGLLVASQPSDIEGRDFILGMSPDLSRIGTLGQVQTSQPAHQQPGASFYQSPVSGTYLGQGVHVKSPLAEQATLLYVEGTIWAIASVPTTSHSASIGTPAASPAPLSTNELATQFSDSHHEFVIVTNAGVSFLVKRRVVDFLKDAIDEVHTEGNVQSILDFRDSFGRDQTCSMLLALASGNAFISIDSTGRSPFDAAISVGPEVASVAKQAFYDLGDRPIYVERGFGGVDNQGQVLFSGRREGLALYLARLLRPIWRAKLTKTGSNNQLGSNVDDKTLMVVQKNLSALKVFLDRNPQLFNLSPGDNVGSRSAHETEAWKVEQASAAQLQTLMSRTIEAISFVLLLVDSHLGDLAAQCDADTQKILSSITYEELITTQNGMNVSRALVNVVINRQIGQQISVDTISEVLQLRCGSFCSADDVMLYKARENVRKAVEVREPAERLALLSESLRLFTRAARVLEFEKLREVCGDYQQLSFARGAVELAIQCAQAGDPDNFGLEYWAAGCPPNDNRAVQLENRLNCYDLVLDSLSVFDDKASKIPNNEGSSKAYEEAESVRSFAYETAFSEKDPLFHAHLYEWMIGRGMSDALLDIRPPFLEAFLQREPISVTNYQLLWQLYVKNEQFLRAAEVLLALAQSDEFDLPLEARIQFLTLAVGNAKSHPVSAAGKHETAVAFLTELEDLLEVAQVQFEAFNTLLPRINEPGEVGEKIRHLQRGLFTVTELFQLYAEPFDLPGIKLLILHVSDHRDDAVVRPIWNVLFEEASREGDPDKVADKVAATVVNYGRRFYPSESSFPLRHVSSLLVRFALAHKGLLPHGWAPRILHDCGVPYSNLWDVFHEMYESQVPPFNDQANVQAISSDIAVLMKDWVDEVKRPQSSDGRGDFPVDFIDRAIIKYLEELEPERTETRRNFEDVRRQLRRYW